MAKMQAWLQPVMFAAALCSVRGLARSETARGGMCPGDLEVAGHGRVSLIKGPGDPDIAVHRGEAVVTHLGGRSYFAEHGSCDGTYSNDKYLALNLIGKTMRFTTDLAGAGCGCNVAFYLVPMKSNRNPSECLDYYCDANDVCGESCAEIDIMEANMYAFHSTLHTQFDHEGFGRGFGGGDGWDGPRDWNASQYGPGSACIDTMKPFSTGVSFPADGEGMLTSMEVVISQEGRDCELYVRLSEYTGMAVLTQVMKDGMTPVISYWSSDKMQWLDGKGQDGKGHCAFDAPDLCPKDTKIYNFTVEDSVMKTPERFAQKHSKAKAHRHTHKQVEHKKLPDECPGDIDFVGYGRVSVVPTGWASDDGASAIEVHRQNGTLIPHMGSRAYFADSCTAGKYDHKDYLKLNVLGHKMRYSVDLSGAGCGCNVALYLVSMHQNTQESTCGDYYCDANSVCGVPCAEIDIMEANQLAWHSTLHNEYDHEGQCVGLGGGDGWNGPRDFKTWQYGKDAQCIDTTKPFDVEVSFPVTGMGILTAMEVTLTQEGRNCPVKAKLQHYKYGMTELSEVLAAGMTPVLSYWSSDKMLWLDGQGKDGSGPCFSDFPEQCAESVKLYDFSIEKLPEVEREKSEVEGVCVDDWIVQPDCVLSFAYNGKEVFGCTREGTKNVHWCSHDATYVGKWSRCEPCEVNLGGKTKLMVNSSIHIASGGGSGAGAWSPEPIAADAMGQARMWGQCGGLAWKGPKECATGSLCQFMNNWFSLCSPPMESGGCYNGWKPDAGCKAEFVFDDTEFHGCSTAGNDGRGWCSLDAVFQGRAVNCTQCQMPLFSQTAQDTAQPSSGSGDPVHVLQKFGETDDAETMYLSGTSVDDLSPTSVVGKFGAPLVAGLLALGSAALALPCRRAARWGRDSYAWVAGADHRDLQLGQLLPTGGAEVEARSSAEFA